VTKVSVGLIWIAVGIPLLIAVSLIVRILNPDIAESPGAVSTMGAARWNHTATLLPNGKVLVVGGLGPGALSSTELYDPSSNSWSPSGRLAVARASHTATLLPSGKVLVVGGQGNSGSLSDAELYDPSSESCSPAGTMAKARSSPSATLLQNGKVLVAGGMPYTDTAELYDPLTNTWSSAGRTLNDLLSFHTATLLPSGNVMVVGRFFGRPKLYKPSSETWSYTGAVGFWSDPKNAYHTATLLPTGKVLVAGGETGRYHNPTSSTFLYDPSSNTWSSAGDMVHSRKGHTATLLPNGKVLVAAGSLWFRVSSSAAELYDPTSDTWSPAGRLAKLRSNHTATLLPSGKVLFAGGQGNSGALSSAELYDPSQAAQTR
jgi:hypothetical protein